jgi:hypothetical protein
MWNNSSRQINWWFVGLIGLTIQASAATIDLRIYDAKKCSRFFDSAQVSTVEKSFNETALMGNTGPDGIYEERKITDTQNCYKLTCYSRKKDRPGFFKSVSGVVSCFCNISVPEPSIGQQATGTAPGAEAAGP